MNTKNIFYFLFLFSISNARIHIIGDSHAKFCFGSPSCYDPEYPILDFLKIHWIGAITMHRIGRDGINFLNVKNFQVRENDTVVFVFGEIDVRCHIGNIRDRSGISLDTILEKLIHAYINTILINKAQYHNLECIIFAVIPPSDYAYNPELPYYGSLEDRIVITKQLNSTLHQYAKKHHIPILDVYEHYADEIGQLKKEISDGNIHISTQHNRYIRKQLAKLV